jgi:predicted acylesterase/phospholipase RssA
MKIIEPFYKTSFADTSKFDAFVAEYLTGREYKRMLSISSVDLKTGKIVLFDETVPDEIRVKSLISSASIPFVFPPVEIDDFVLVDGGNFMNLDIGDPIERCREKGFADVDIIVDIIMCLSDFPQIPNWKMGQTEFLDALSFFKRRKQMGEYYQDFEDLTRLTRGFHNVKFRYVLAPTKQPPIGGFIPISATRDEI